MSFAISIGGLTPAATVTTLSCTRRKRISAPRWSGHQQPHAFGTRKIDYARHLAACLAYLLSTQQTWPGWWPSTKRCARSCRPGRRRPISIGSSVRWSPSDRQADRPVAPTARPVRAAAAAQPGDPAERSVGCARRIGQALQHLRYRKHQGMVLHLLDKAEIDLPYDKQVTFQALETNEKIQVDPADVPRCLSSAGPRLSRPHSPGMQRQQCRVPRNVHR